MDFLKKLAEALGLEENATEDQVLEAIQANPLADIVKALELADDADTAKVVEAVTALKAKDPEQSLEDRAKAEGKVVVDASDYADTKRNAERGRKAAEELHQSKFDQAFEKALEDVRVDAKDETRERYQKLYDADPEATLEVLDNLPKIAPTEPRGRSGKRRETGENTAEDRAALDAEVKAFMKEHPKLTYAEALDAVIEAQEAEEDAD